MFGASSRTSLPKPMLSPGAEYHPPGFFFIEMAQIYVVPDVIRDWQFTNVHMRKTHAWHECWRNLHRRPIKSLSPSRARTVLKKKDLPFTLGLTSRGWRRQQSSMNFEKEVILLFILIFICLGKPLGETTGETKQGLVLFVSQANSTEAIAVWRCSKTRWLI